MSNVCQTGLSFEEGLEATREVEKLQAALAVKEQELKLARSASHDDLSSLSTICCCGFTRPSLHNVWPLMSRGRWY